MEYTSDAVGLLTILAQVLLPIAVAVVTRASANGSVKAVTLLAMTTSTQFVSAWAEGFDHFDLPRAGLNAAVGFTISVATYYGLWKPTGVTESASSVGPQ
jgi:hypothetical protein